LGVHLVVLVLAAPALFLKGMAFYAFLAEVLIWSEALALRLYRMAGELS
jgi:hypothetical protein